MFINMVVAEILSQHLFYGSSVIVSVDADKLEGSAHNIDDVVNEPSGFITFHAVYVGSNLNFSVPHFGNIYAAQFFLR